MNKMKNIFQMWLLPLLLVLITTSCDDRLGLVVPPVITIPTVISTNPVSSAADVAFTQKITATFSEPMNSSTITTATFTLMQGTSFVSGTVSYSGTMATFSPSSNLASNTAYTATITTGAKDSEGTAIANNYVWSFTTGVQAVILPTIISTDPVNLATSVVLNKQITATFSTAMEATTIQTTTFILTQGTTPVVGFVSYSGTTATFAPLGNLAPNTTYTATLTTGAKDLSGNALANNYVWSFTTGAATAAPMVISTDPTNAAIDVALNKHITATFSKIMDASTITTATFTLMQGTTFVSGTVSYSGTTATYVPSSNLMPNTKYTATITTRAMDLAGIAMTSNYVWSFTTSISYIVTLSSDPLAGGTTSGGGTFNSGASVTVTAVPNAGYTFTNWTENGVVVTSSLSYQFTINGNRSLVANYAIIPPTQFTVTLSSFPLAGGTTSGGGAFNSGSSVIITATPNAGYTFTNWTEAGATISTNPIYQFSISGNRILVANFTAIPPTQFTATLLSIPSAGGTTSGGGTFNSGSSVTIIATPNPGYTFTNWTENGIVLTSSTSYQFAITANRTLTANFTAIPPAQYTVTLSSSPLAGGTTSGGGTFNSGASVLLTATPNTGFTFTNWTESGVVVSTNPIYQFTITAHRLLVANFTAVAPTQFVVTLLSIPSLGGTTSGSGTFNSGSSVTVTATPNVGYTFTNWTENGIVLTSSTSYQFSISGNRTLTANFTLAVIPYTVELSSNPSAGGTTNGGGTYNSGSSVTVSATANTGYSFTNWTQGATIVSTNANYTFTITSNKIFVANFSAVGPSGPAAVDLGAAGVFAILAGSGVSSTGLSTVYGDVGAFPTATINGFPPAVVVGTLYMSADPIVGTAKNALTAAYNDAQGRSLNAISLPGQLGGLTLAPGLYVNSSTSGISGTGPNGILTLDAGGNPNAVWIFKMGSTLITDAGTSIVLAGGAKWENIFWSVGTSATLGTNSIFYGNILADQAITLTTGASLRGRALTRIAAVTLDASIVDKR